MGFGGDGSAAGIAVAAVEIVLDVEVSLAAIAWDGGWCRGKKFWSYFLDFNAFYYEEDATFPGGDFAVVRTEITEEAVVVVKVWEAHFFNGIGLAIRDRDTDV